ncbi:MAG: preprotein translocase subunit SecE [Planctomycetota bacterium]|jgi:preprotein translocase SecE subunit
MAIHRWGEGVWARGIALAIVATFIIWGAFDFYYVPKAAAVIVEAGGVIREAEITELSEHRNSDPTVPARLNIRAGFANQDVSAQLKDAKVAANISTPGRGMLARLGDKLSDEQIDAIRQAGIERIPVEGLNTRPVDFTLVGGRLAEPVIVSQREELWNGEKVSTADELKTLHTTLNRAEPPIATAGWQLVDGNGKKRAWTAVSQLTIGDALVRVEPAKGTIEGPLEATTLFEKGKDLTYEDITTLHKNDVANVRMEAGGVLYLDPQLGGTNYSAQTYAKFYFTAGESRNRKTWWTAQVWLVPVVEWPLTGGGIVCLAVMIALLIVAWNYLNRPKLVDLFIETQLEMKKVSWPKGRELASSSIVVMAFIVFVASWLALADYVFVWLASLIGVYGGK